VMVETDEPGLILVRRGRRSHTRRDRRVPPRCVRRSRTHHGRHSRTRPGRRSRTRYRLVPHRARQCAPAASPVQASVRPVHHASRCRSSMPRRRLRSRPPSCVHTVTCWP
jgi:hypothetical protein